MKPIRKFFIIGGFFALLSSLHAQDTTDSVVVVTAQSLGLNLVSPADLPDTGTFWMVTPDGITAPMPCPPQDSSLPVFAIADGEFLVDATGGQVTPGDGQSVPDALAALADDVANLVNQIQAATPSRNLSRGGAHPMDDESPPDPGDGTDDTNTYTLGSPLYYIPSTNDLWLQITNETNSTTFLVIHPPWNVTNGVYDLLYTTNLALPVSWQWILRTDPGQTNLVISNAVDGVGFYRLGLPNDLVANDSLGTNFWLAFMETYIQPYSHSENTLSLSISSPVGATGTVSIPEFYVNGATVIVTNCGDATVNGTYVLTNLTTQEQADWDGSYTVDSTASSYVKGTNWIGYGFNGVGYSYIFEYDPANPGSDNLNFLYYKEGINLNATNSEWIQYYDPNPTNPTTICPQILFNKSFSVAAGAATNIAIDNRIMISGDENDLIGTNGINVSSSAPVSVYGFNYYLESSTAFTCYPTPLLGTNYYLMARPPLNSYGSAELAIVATVDDTTVIITPSTNSYLGGHTTAYSMNLQKGQTYQIASNGGLTGDVTGTRITSSAPVGVFAGVTIAFVPDESTQAGNPLMQVQLPVESWGTNVLCMGFAGRTNGDSYRVLAAYTNTVVTITGAVVTIVDETDEPPWSVTISNEVVSVTLTNAGQFYDIIVAEPVEFQASQPIQVAHFANGTYFDHGNNPFEGDPCEILLPPTGHYLATNIVVTMTNELPYQVIGDFDENFLNIIVSESAISTTSVDGMIVAATNFVAIGASGYYGAQLTITNSGTHTVTSSQPVGVEVYGFGQVDAYGYFGGIVK